MFESKPPSTRRIWIARAIALAADGLQIGVFPMFMEGMLSPANAVLDVVVAAAMILLVGWHIAFIPAFIVEALPFADLAPTWTLAVFVATRGKGSTASADDLRLPLK
jgi:hypothetical protein